MGFIKNLMIPSMICLNGVTSLLENRDRDDTYDIEENEFIGDIPTNVEIETELALIFATASVRGGGKKKNKEKKLQRQKIKKTKHVLRLLKFAEPDRKARDWLGYGCYCFADAKSDILTPGVGKAIDPIDRACRSLTECLKCSEYDYGISKRCHPHVGYKYESLDDGEVRSINCLDDAGSCQRSMCECDRKFLQAIQEHTYDKNLQEKSGFDRMKTCPKRAQREEEGKIGDENGSKTTLAGRMTQPEDNATQQCCGPPGERHLISITPTRGCCSTSTYNPFVLDCCADGTIVPVGSC